MPPIWTSMEIMMWWFPMWMLTFRRAIAADASPFMKTSTAPSMILMATPT
ncbi:MAG: hypothetical protein HOH96_07545 [Flavobacteriales bacterium]|nr:hypothetical protein [Flavobacteriales bacterium]